MTAQTIAIPDISVVIPCLNEEENAPAIAAAVTKVLENAGVSFDIIFIDNHSSDRTVEVIRELCARDPRIRLIVNTRNFGQMRSPTHGIFEARGRAVIGMCADFQDPPELLGAFVERWRAGTDIVLGVRETESTSLLLGWAREFSYAFVRKVGDYPVIRNATGFGLYDRRVVDAIKAIREPEPFFRGMLVETGYKIETIPYSRPIRRRGKSNNNFFTLLDFALSGLTSSSKKLLRAPFFIGAIAGIGAGLCLIGLIASLILGNFSWGWLAAFAAQAQLALLFIFMGLIGDQLRMVSERTRDVPLVFERERVNFPEGY
ncbi:glycosyltransferase family 2 protein [Tsuneonella sp. CC-YZS046]|uniref:glycosyltransferase family 2 protein n=1 Tax=Tsuneonella sp. CC-YZS046 TaxID=3042152 RepID=UPI002D783F9D|nr:glycosyltransferase family 2 protein [Tsuneonella sp. CC-YZS046]WRO65591.1 glycosyltransferase family 2 protein [Tsuneonella sp. CC-YZS046]